jgi:nucleoside-diphosphate kinase
LSTYHTVDLPQHPSWLISLPIVLPLAWIAWLCRKGENAVKMGRQMLGATNPQESMPGTIRGDFSIIVGRNICHGSDSPENAEKEIGLWFDEGEVLDWDSHSEPWVYE